MIKKKWAYAMSILSLSTSLVTADQGSRPSKNKNKNPKPRGVTSQPTEVITPPVGPRVQGSADLIFTADFIYWKPHQDGLEFAQSAVQNNTLTVGSTLSQGTITETSSSFEPGFKVGLGLEFAHDGWDIFADYTWLAPTRNTKTVTGATPSTLSNTWTNSQMSANYPLQQASGSWKLNYNVLDLELGRNFFLSRFLTLRPHFGLKAAWLEQHNNVYYVLGQQLTFPFTDLSISMTQKYWGIGVRGGFDAVWHFCKNFGMYGDMALAALWSKNKTTRTDTFQNPSGSATAQGFNYHRGFHNVTPVLELGLGLVYMTWFHDDEYIFDLRAGWEEQVWFDTNHFFDSTRPNGNFTTQGLTLKAGFAF